MWIPCIKLTNQMTGIYFELQMLMGRNMQVWHFEHFKETQQKVMHDKILIFTAIYQVFIDTFW